VNEFKYLGTLVMNSKQITAEICCRIGITNCCQPGLKDILKSRCLKGKPKTSSITPYSNLEVIAGLSIKGMSKN
jgi:hypothetical protein